MAKLGDTVKERIPRKYELTTDTSFYWDRSGWPCDSRGKRLFVDDFREYILDTPERVDEFNRKISQT